MKMLLPAINVRDQDNPQENGSAAAACSFQAQARAASTMANTTTVALVATSHLRETPRRGIPEESPDGETKQECEDEERGGHGTFSGGY
jgi:hypothetical protein